MYWEERNPQLHALIGHLEDQSLRAWARQTHRDYSTADALALQVKKVSTELERKAGGKITLTILVKGIRPIDDARFWFSLQIWDFRGYTVTAESSTLD